MIILIFIQINYNNKKFLYQKLFVTIPTIDCLNINKNSFYWSNGNVLKYYSLIGSILSCDQISLSYWMIEVCLK